MPESNLSSADLRAQKIEQEKRKEQERAEQRESHTLSSLLEECGLEEHTATLVEKTTLNDLQSRLAVNRPHMLDCLKNFGIAKLGERQRFANAMSRAEKAGQLPPPTLSFPHLKPAIFEETEDTVSVRLALHGGTAPNQLSVHFDATSVRVQYMGGPTAASGKLYGPIRPSESHWQIERTPEPEYDPLTDAAEQPPTPDDTLLLSLAKDERGGWKNLFSDGGLARR